MGSQSRGLKALTCLVSSPNIKMAMVEDSERPKTTRCFNCMIYNWTSEITKNMLMNCQKCKAVYYCSKECQKEHWIKVHKKHCSKLAAAVVHSETTFHDRANLERKGDLK